MHEIGNFARACKGHVHHHQDFSIGYALFKHRESGIRDRRRHHRCGPDAERGADQTGDQHGADRQGAARRKRHEQHPGSDPKCAAERDAGPGSMDKVSFLQKIGFGQFAQNPTHQLLR